jgi:hypothetical protein
MFNKRLYDVPVLRLFDRKREGVDVVVLWVYLVRIGGIGGIGMVVEQGFDDGKLVMGALLEDVK